MFQFEANLSGRGRWFEYRRRKLYLERLEDRRVLAVALAEGIWIPQDESAIAGNGVSAVAAVDYDLYNLDLNTLKNVLDTAPLEFVDGQQYPTIELPNLEGGFDHFEVAYSPIYAADFSVKYPGIRTYVGRNLDEPSMTTRLDVTYRGFHASVQSSLGDYEIRSYYPGGAGDLYSVYSTTGLFHSTTSARENILDVVYPDTATMDAYFGGESDNQSNEGDDVVVAFMPPSGVETAALSSGTALRTYRIGLAANSEFSAAAGGTFESVQSAIVTSLNVINFVLERDIATRFVLIGNNDVLAFINGANPNGLQDPFTVADLGANLSENQTLMDTQIGSGSYDIGHVFVEQPGGGAAGLAALSVLGRNGVKAMGASSRQSGIPGDFEILYDTALHELGHQMSANHTFAYCGGANDPRSSVEPGSGSTIMSYSGACGPDDIDNYVLGPNRYFHSYTVSQIMDHLDRAVPNVGTRVPTGNSVPSVSTVATSGLTIPANTPFLLEAIGTDANNPQDLHYLWEQRDANVNEPLSAGDTGAGAIIRSYPAKPTSTRYIPRLDILADPSSAPVPGEILPTTNRSLNFTVTALDNFPGGGAFNTDDLQINVVDTGTPFSAVNPEPGLVWDGISEQTIQWEVAGTNQAPIATSEVTVLWSIDGGLSFPFVAAGRIPNTGQGTIRVPNFGTDNARFLVRGYDNIFFAVSTVDIKVEEIPILLELRPATAHYIENSPPVAIAPATVVSMVGAVNNLTVEVAVGSGAQTGDRISLIEDDLISLSGNEMLYNGTVVATFEQTDHLLLTFNANGTQSILQDVLRRVAFDNATDNPRSITRQIEFTFAGSARHYVNITVEPTNDPPSTTPVVFMPTILEDSAVIVGATVAELFSPGFTDPDEGASFGGIAIIGNPQNASQGLWHYATGLAWIPVGYVDDLSSQLALPPNARLGFLPAPDYFGIPEPLAVRVLDETYTGPFSSVQANERAYFTGPESSLSLSIAELQIEVINVNDPPIANVNGQSFQVVQDQPIDRQLSENLFSDFDSTLTWSITNQVGYILPTWISFDPATRELGGTPRNSDVGVYHLLILVTDGEYSASIPLTITVFNVNDPPNELRFVALPAYENQAGLQIGTLFATDPDGNAVVWTSSDPRITLQGNEVVLNEAIDYELVQSIPVTFTATDDGDPSLSSELNVTIQIVDVNEFYPLLVGDTYTLSTGTPGGTLATQLLAPDGDTLQTVRFRLRDGDVDAFLLDEATGYFSFIADADANLKSEYKVFVEAYDNGTPQLATTAQFIVIVTPVNEFPPVIDPDSELSFAENSSPGTEIGQIVASDADGTPLVFEVIEVKGGALNWVTIDPNSGVLRLTAAADFDYESGIEYAIRVRVTESLLPFQSAEMLVPIHLADSNDPASSLEPISIFTSRMGISATPFTVIDPDSSVTSYSFETEDPRFEIRGGVLALRPEAYLDASLAGTTTSAVVRVTDNFDSTSVADLSVVIHIVHGFAWQNPLNALDVNRDGRVSPQDALIIVNQLNGTVVRQLDLPRPFEQLDEPDYDTSGDDRLSPLDALLVVNYLNSRSQSGVGASEPEGEASSALMDPNMWLQAYVELENDLRKKR